MLDIRAAYDAHDKAALKKLANVAIPRLKGAYRRFRADLENDWKERYKPFGYEIYSIDLAGAYQRLDDTARILNDYADGRIDRIAELDEPVLPHINHFGGGPRKYMRTM